MASIKETLNAMLAIEGAKAAAVVDRESGMVLGKEGGGIDLDIGGAGSTEVVRAQLQMMRLLGLRDAIDDILITVSTQYHIIRPVAGKPGIFLYLVLEKAKSNLALARLKTKECDEQLSL